MEEVVRGSCEYSTIMSNIYLGPSQTVEHTAHNIIFNIPVHDAKTKEMLLLIEVNIIAPRYQQLSSIQICGMHFTRKRFGPDEDLLTVITQLLANFQFSL